MHVLYAFAAPVEAGSLPTEPFGESSEFLCLGVGKTASAHALTRRLVAAPRPDLVVLFGVCGAHAGVANPVRSREELDVGDVCVVIEDCLADEGVQTETEFLDLVELGLVASQTYPMDPHHTAEVAAILGDVARVKGSTVSTCSGDDRSAKERAQRVGAHIETMEGAAVAHVCHEMQVPMVQLRCVSNRTGDRDRGGWELDAACARVQAAVRTVIEGLTR